MTPASSSVGPFSLTPRLPGDKSITHRAYLLAALARGESRIERGNTGRDCNATLNAVRALGCAVTESGPHVLIGGCGGSFQAVSEPLDLENSGTGLRLLLGVLAAQPFTTVLTGDHSLRRRPMERVLEPLRRMGADVTSTKGTAPVSLRGAVLRGITYALPVPSAQVKSALLLAGLQAEGTLRITGGEGSRDHTERMLPEFGARLEWDSDGATLAGPQSLTGTILQIPGDVSAAMFYLAAMVVVPGSEVTLQGVGQNPTRTQGLGVFEEMGMELDRVPGPEPAAEPRGTVRARGNSYTGVTIGPEDIPGLIDELPLVAVAAAFAEGSTRVTGAGELRVKESDRLKTVGEGLRAIGAPVRLLEDGWEIQGSGGERLPGGEVSSRGDHRVAMAFLVAGLGCHRGVRITDDPGIGTSDPHFMENLKHIAESS